MKYNICPIHPPGYVHAHAFDEVAALVAGGLIDLGQDVTQKPNTIDPDARNIIIGCHLLDYRSGAIVPENSIILNTEQLSSEIGSWNENILNWLRSYQAWDYSLKNIENIKSVGLVPPKHLMLGYHEALRALSPADCLDVDVLFYGSMNKRRRDILDALIARGLKVKELFGVYGPERDEWIARSKLILNVHFFNTQIFEIVRCFYLMINSKAVVAEVDHNTSIDPAYRAGVRAVPYGTIVDECIRLCKDIDERKSLELRAKKTIEAMPQAQLMAHLIQ